MTLPAALPGAACLDMDQVEADAVFFPNDRNFNANRALAVCCACAAREACRAQALEAERGLGITSRWGVVGGLTAEERWRLDGGAA